jgi:hypothetical protein
MAMNEFLQVLYGSQPLILTDHEHSSKDCEDKSFLFKGKDRDMVVSSNLDLEFASY